MKYTSLGANKGAKIKNSHEMRNLVDMYEYINENRGDEISGSTTGVVMEWLLHNIAYDLGKAANSVGLVDLGQRLIDRGEDLDVGNTIYDDKHGLVSAGMFFAYARISPATAAYDLVVKALE